MGKGMYNVVVLVTVVEQDVAEKFGKAIFPHSSEEIIKEFIHSVANGELEIKQMGE